MKKILPLILLSLCATLSGMAQDKMYVWRTDGTYTVVHLSEIDSITFAWTVPGACLQCPDNHHPHAIDLGLPSGTKWACCNVGAAAPEDDGGYYAWGETEEKSDYSESTYKHYDNGYQDIGDNISGTAYDAARANWGGNWQMPTQAQLEELLNNGNLTWTWTTKTTADGQTATGYEVTGVNGGSLFLPAAGWRKGTDLYRHGTGAGYWASTVYDEYKDWVSTLLFYTSGGMFYNYYRYYGRTVRAVCP